MNILYICNKDPRLINGGNEQRTNLLWNALKTIGNVYTIVYNSNCTLNQQDNKEHIYFIDIELDKYYTLKGFAYRVIEYLIGFSCLPYRFPISTMPNDVIQYIKFDVVVSRYIHFISRYHLWKIAPTFVDIDDHPLQVFETIIYKNIPVILRPFSKALLKIQFSTFLNKIKGGWIANPHQVIFKNNISYLPNIPIFPSPSYYPKDTNREYLFTIGVMSYTPNSEGVDRFLSECWNIFHEKYPNIKYIIAGKGANKELVKKWSKYEGVKYVGFVDNLDMTYQKAIATIVPIYSGGGTCIKTIESLAYSRVCLSTPFGARGFTPVDGQTIDGLKIFNNVNEFIKAFETLQITENLDKMESDAKRYVDAIYSLESFKCIVTKKIEDLYG